MKNSEIARTGAAYAAGIFGANEDSNPSRKRPQFREEETSEPKILSDNTDDEDDELIDPAAAYPRSRIKSLINAFQWLPLDSDPQQEFIFLKQWLDCLISQKGAEVRIEPPSNTTSVQNRCSSKFEIKIVAKRESEHQLHMPLLSMVLNKVHKTGGRFRNPYPRALNYPEDESSSKTENREWIGRSVIISSTEGRLLSFDGSQISELDISLNCYGCVTSMARYTPTDTGSTCEWNSYLFFGTCEGYLCIVSRDTFVRKIAVGSAVTCVEVCPDTDRDYIVAVGDVSGYVSMFRPSGLNSFVMVSRLSVTRLYEHDLKEYPQAELTEASCSVKSVVPLRVLMKDAQFFTYIIACTEHPWLSIFKLDEEIDRLYLPSHVVSITSGYFEHISDRETSGPNVSSHKRIIETLNNQALVYLENNSFYLIWFSNDGVFKLSKWTSSDSKVTKLTTLNSRHLYPIRSSHGMSELKVGSRLDKIFLDYVLCSGHFIGVEIWKDKQLLHVVKTSDWICDLVVDTVVAPKLTPSKNTVISGVFKSQTSIRVYSKIRIVTGLWNRVIESYLVSIYE